MPAAIELEPGVSAIAAFNMIAAALLARIEANQEGVIDEDDPEYLHQMRVTVRRLRSLCGAYETFLPKTTLQPLIEDLRWLARALGPARDADVFAIEIWPPLRAALCPNPLLAELDARWEARRHAAMAKARRALGTRRYQCFMLSISRMLAEGAGWAGASLKQRAVLDASARDFTRRVIERRDGKVRGHGHTLAGLDSTHLHALRIRIKKLRYAVDSFGALFERDAVRGMIDALARLQHVLGEMHDLHVAEQQVLMALRDRRARAVATLQTALAAWRDARTTALRRKLRAAWRRYRRAEKLG